MPGKSKDCPFYLVSREKNKCILYFPLKKAVLETDVKGLSELNHYVRNRSEFNQTPFVNRIKQKGFLDMDVKSEKSEKIAIAFHPTAVTIFPTMDCNLRCIYCYSSGGEDKSYMELGLAKACVNQILENALITSSKQMYINFHGGGEPTLNWEVLQNTVLYAKELGEVFQKEVFISCGTNGNMPRQRLEWLLANIDSLCLSLDGVKGIHDRQRPRNGGGSSFDAAMQTLEQCEKKDFPYQIRTTVTKYSLPYIYEFYNYLRKTAPHATVFQLEPLFPTGRAIKTEEEPPSWQDFLNLLCTLGKKGKEDHYPVSFAACNIDNIRDRYCGAYGNSFVVLPSGNVTTCYEVCAEDDIRWAYFHIGHYDQALGKFEFYHEKIKHLQTLCKEHLKGCGDCLARFHCAGDCPAKRLFPLDDEVKHGRCSMIKELVKQQILDNIDNHAFGDLDEAFSSK